MTNAFKGIGAFLLLLVNLALTPWMIFETRRLYLLLFNWFLDTRQAEGSELVQTTYGLQTIDALILVVLGLLALGLLVFIEARYRKALPKGQLFKVFFFVVGVQLSFLGGAQLFSELVKGELLELSLRTALIVFELAAGVNLIWLGRREQRPKPNLNSLENQD